MTGFEFATATRVVFGVGSATRAGELIAGLGRRGLVVCGRTSQRARPVVDALNSSGISMSMFSVFGEPDIDTIDRGASLARNGRCDVVVGVGGGSVLDAAKAIAAMAPQPGNVLDHLEVIGRATSLSQPSLPCVAVPTTAGTGSEVTRNAVLTSPEHRLKVSLRGPQLFPRLAIVDPDLTRDLPPHLTALTGLDALTQLIEPYGRHVRIR